MHSWQINRSKTTIRVIKNDVYFNTLLPVDLISVSGETLYKFKCVITVVNFTGYLVRSCRFKPAVSPLLKINLRLWFYFEQCFLQALNELLQCRILVRISFDVFSNRPLQCFPTQEVIHCFYPTCTLLVRDHIKLTDSIASVSNFYTDRVRAGFQISIEG